MLTGRYTKSAGIAFLIAKNIIFSVTGYFHGNTVFDAFITGWIGHL
jgi:hypothetical protein